MSTQHIKMRYYLKGTRNVMGELKALEREISRKRYPKSCCLANGLGTL